MNRMVMTIILALVLMFLVMGVAAAVTFTGVAARTKWAINETWEQPAPSVQSIKVTNMTGAGKTDLFVQAGSTVLVFDVTGKSVYGNEFSGTTAALTGDVNGDGVQEIIAYYKTAQGSIVAAFQVASGKTLWQLTLAGLGDVGRATAVDWSGTSKYGVVIGDMNGKLVAISESGKERWRYDMKAAELRGLDDVVLGGSTHLVAAADRGGSVVVLDSNGKPAWQFTAPGGLRRLRTYELTGIGHSTVLVGGEAGTIYALEGGTGKTLWRADVGQAVTEIRMAELDGNTATHELVAGGKKGGVWAFSQTGAQLFSGSVSEKVTEIALLDADGSGRDMVAIGDESGQVTFFDSTGSKLVSRNYSAPINRMLGGKYMKERQFIVADASQIRAMTLEKQTAPIWYTPLLAGLLACVVIAVVAFIIGSMRPAPTLQIGAEQMTVEAQKARRIMLHESIADLKRLHSAGQIPPDAYLARLKDLRAQLADAEANLIKMGVPLQAETITCPHCGGTLQLGTDRCEYCGQTVIV